MPKQIQVFYKPVSHPGQARIILKMGLVHQGGIVHLDDVGGAIAFQKIRDRKGKLVDTLAYSDEDEIALDYKLIQDMYGTDCYNIYLR